MTGERRGALRDLVAKAKESGKLEDGKGPWNTPAFPVPKKVQGTYRLVQDLLPQNEATLKDGHPLPRIGEMLQRQGKKLHMDDSGLGGRVPPNAFKKGGSVYNLHEYPAGDSKMDGASDGT